MDNHIPRWIDRRRVGEKKTLFAANQSAVLLLVSQIVVFTEFANALAAVVAPGRKDVGFVADVPHRVMPSLTHRDGRPLFRDDQSGQVNTETLEVMKIHAGTVDHNVHFRQRSSLLPAQSRQRFTSIVLGSRVLR